MNNQEKPELNINDLIIILFALSDRIDKLHELMDYAPQESARWLKESIDLRVKIKQILSTTSATPPRIPE